MLTQDESQFEAAPMSQDGDEDDEDVDRSRGGDSSDSEDDEDDEDGEDDEDEEEVCFCLVVSSLQSIDYSLCVSGGLHGRE